MFTALLPQSVDATRFCTAVTHSSLPNVRADGFPWPMQSTVAGMIICAGTQRQSPHPQRLYTQRKRASCNAQLRVKLPEQALAKKADAPIYDCPLQICACCRADPHDHKRWHSITSAKSRCQGGKANIPSRRRSNIGRNCSYCSTCCDCETLPTDANACAF